MKYARLIYGNNKKRLSSEQYINVGDYIQTFAIDKLYERMNIKQDDIRTIDRAHMHEYDNENVILPMQGCFRYIKGTRRIPLPSKIEPVFIGYSSVSKAYYTKECIEYYRKHSPVYCRDEGTYKMMRRDGVEAYLTGCLTLTLPEREKEPEKGKVFLVDAPPSVEKYMPEDLRKNITYVTHEIQWIQTNSDEYEQERIETLSKEILERYKKEATLVVTSRLHCAAPCMAMGIPVILVRNYFDERYMWIDKFLPLYTPDRFGNIDWYPEKVDLSEIKPLLIDMAKKVILDSKDKEKVVKQIHDYYMDRKREKTHIPFYVNAYFALREKMPKLADFMREVVLKKYTVATARDKADYNGLDYRKKIEEGKKKED